MAIIAVVHLVGANRISSELALLMIAGGVGLVWESMLVQGGFLAYPTAESSAGYAPYWIVAMWLLLMTLFTSCREVWCMLNSVSPMPSNSRV